MNAYMRAIPPRCPRAGNKHGTWCPTHGVSCPAGRYWCAVSWRYALGQRDQLWKMAGETPGKWWRCTAFRRMLWRRRCKQLEDAAYAIDRLLWS